MRVLFWGLRGYGQLKPSKHSKHSKLSKRSKPSKLFQSYQTLGVEGGTESASTLGLERGINMGSPRDDLGFRVISRRNHVKSRFRKGARAALAVRCKRDYCELHC